MAKALVLRCRGLVTGVAGGEQRSCSGDGAAAALRERRKEEEEEGRATEWREWLGSPGQRPDQGGCRWPAAARSSLAYGRHVADAG